MTHTCTFMTKQRAGTVQLQVNTKACLICFVLICFTFLFYNDQSVIIFHDFVISEKSLCYRDSDQKLSLEKFKEGNSFSDEIPLLDSNWEWDIY